MNKISHQQAQQYIQDAADQPLSEEQQRLLSAHLAECAACRQYQAEIDDLQDTLRRTFYARVSRHGYPTTAASPSRQSIPFYRRLQREIYMKNVQRISYTVLGVLIMVIVAVAGIYLSRKAIPVETPATVPTQEVLPTQPVQEGNENVTITFAAEPAAKSVYQSLIEAFQQENPDITVQFVEMDPTAQLDFPAQASLADTSLLSGRSTVIASQGYFRDLTPLIEADASFQADDFWPDALSGCQDSAGRSLGIPLSLYFNGILYDGAALDADGLARPQAGWSWEDFRQTLMGMSAGSSPSREYPFVDQIVLLDDPRISFLYLLAPTIDAHLRESNGVIDAAALTQSLQWYVDLVAEKRIFPLTEYEKSEALTNLYADGSPAIWIGATNSWIDDGSALTQYEMAPFPMDSDAAGAPTSPLIPVCGAISAGSDHSQEAWAWLNFLSRQWIHGDERLVYINDAIPARTSVAESNRYWDTVPANALDAIRFGVQHGWYGSPYPAALNLVTRALLQATSGETDLAAALEQASTALDGLPAAEVQPTPVVVATPRPENSTATTIRFFPQDIFANGATYQSLGEEFTRLHPEYQVEFPSVQNPVDFPSSGDDLLYFPAENYDCFELSLPQLSSKDLTVLYDLNTWLDQDTALRADIYPAQLDAYSLDGKVYGLPVSVQPNLMFYNQDLLERLGIDPPTNDWTFDDFIRMATAASTTLDGQKVYGFAPFASRDVGLLLAGRGVEWLELGGLFPGARFDQPEASDAYRWIAGLVQSGVLLPTTAGDSSDAIQTTLYAGRLAFWTAESEVWGGWYLNRPDPLDIQVGGVPLPQTQALNTANNPGMTGLFISRNSQNPQACWAWMEFLSRQPAAFAGIPARRSVASSAAWEAQVGADKAAVFRAAMEQEGPKPASWEEHELNSLFYWSNKVLGDVIDGIDADLALATAQHKSDALSQCLETSNVLNLSAMDREAAILACLQQINSAP